MIKMNLFVIPFLLFSFLSISMKNRAQVVAPPGNLKKVALVVGVSDYYMNGPSLRCPVRDARAVATSLQQFGFRVVLLTDPNMDQFRHGADSLNRMKQDASVCLFYFSGHVGYWGGDNALIFPDGTCPLNVIVGTMCTCPEMKKIVIIDGCCNQLDPAILSNRRSMLQEQRPYGRNLLEVFATAPTLFAYEDTSQVYSVFTERMLHYFLVPNLSVEKLFTLVCRDVSHLTNKKEIPVRQSSLEEEYFFFIDTSAEIPGVATAPMCQSVHYSMHDNNINSMANMDL